MPVSIACPLQSVAVWQRVAVCGGIERGGGGGDIRKPDIQGPELLQYKLVVSK